MIKRLTAKRNCIGLTNDKIIEQILADRGISDLVEFLCPDETSLVPFEELKGLQAAYEIVDDAVTMGENFLVLSDVDTDGVSSSAIIARYLRSCGANVICVINEGKKHGAEDFDLTLLDGIGVMIIVDSLNNDPAVYKRITDTGVKLIVLDHHIPSQELLNSDVPFVLVSSAVDYPNPALSGAGVCLKFCLYCDDMNVSSYADELWVYAAIGITADMCDLSIPENRYIVSKGLEQYYNPAVQKLVGNYLFNTESISFSIAPLLNAAMRMFENELAMNVFLTDDKYEIDTLVKGLQQCRERQNELVASLMADLTAQGEVQLGNKAMYFVLDEVDGDVAGMLGNKLLEIYQRPLFVIRDCGDKWQGSMRAVGVPNMLAIVNATNLGQCSGHELAAGFTCDKVNFEAFKAAIEAALADIEFTCDVEADIEISAEQVNEDLIKQLAAINRVSGTGFRPISCLIRTRDYDVQTFTSRKHLKVVDRNTGVLLVKWNDMSWQTMSNGGEFVGVGVLSNPYYGRKKFLQLTLDNYVKTLDNNGKAW